MLEEKMTRRNFLLWVLVAACMACMIATAQAGILDKVKEKVEDKAEKTIEEQVDKTLEGKKEEEKDTEVSTPASTEGETETNSGAETDDMALYTKFDFVPGNKVIFYDDMKGEEEGEFPMRWDLENGVWEIARVGKDRWIMSSANGEILPKIPSGSFPPKYTVEMDFHLLTDEHFIRKIFFVWKNAENKDIAHIHLYRLQTTEFSVDGKKLAVKEIGRLKKGTHTLRIMATTRSIKCYIDEIRVANIPKVENFNPARFSVRVYGWNENENTLLIRNFRFAEGGKSMREQLDETGKIITHGILFDVDSYKIKGESYKTLQQIGQILQDDPKLRLSIEGHTDNDGSDEYNATLSQNRANSVRNYLISTYNVDSSRLEAKGWGESQPIDTNDTLEGKANNRRVELVKL